MIYKQEVSDKTHIVLKDRDNSVEWFDARLWMPNPNHTLVYPCVVKSSPGAIWRSSLVMIKYLRFIPEHPYNHGYWEIGQDEEILYFTILGFPHELIKYKL